MFFFYVIFMTISLSLTRIHILDKIMDAFIFFFIIYLFFYLKSKYELRAINSETYKSDNIIWLRKSDEKFCKIYRTYKYKSIVNYRYCYRKQFDELKKVIQY